MSGPIVFVGIDPGQRGAVAAVRSWGGSTRAAVVFGGGASGYHGPTLRAGAAQMAIAEVVAQVGGGADPVVVGLERLGLRESEGVRSTSTASESWGVWRAVLELHYPDSHRLVQTQQVDRAMGLPQGMGAARKVLVIHEVSTSLARVGVRLSLVPPGGRVPSDGAADALLIAMALERGL